MSNYHSYSDNARMFFDDAPVGVLNSTQIRRPRRGTIGRYVNILLDEWFKKILGSSKNKDILLNILQELIPERKIVDIKYDRKTVRKRNVFKDCHDAFFDVECIDGDGTRFVVEMQRAHQEHFHDRALFYSTFPLQEQVLARGKALEANLEAEMELGLRPETHDLHFDYPPVYVVSFLNFSFHPFSERIVYRYDLRERESGELMTDRVNFIFLEMTNYKRGYDEPHPEDSFAEKFSWALTHMSSLTERPMALMEEVFAKIFEACEVSALNSEERKDYRNDMTTQWDIDDIVNSRYWKGKAEGRAEGRAEAKAEYARAMLADGVDTSLIVKYTGLSLEEIAALQQVCL